jgi:putative peptide zinc metalloprotease protein
MFPRRIVHKLLGQRRRPSLPRPRLTDGVELLGPYKDSGYREPPYLARRADGQIVQLTRLLHLVAAECDGRRDAAEIARRVSEKFGRTLTPANVMHLVEQKLQPSGLVGEASGTAARPRVAVPLAFTVRRAVVPPAVVRVLATLFKPLFRPTAIGGALASLVWFDVWVVTHGGVAAGVREVLARPALLLALFGLALLATVFHEIGHASACRYGGALPGAMGVGLYLVWPAFYTDITDAYRLDRRGRLRTDLGGIYFNGLFVLVLAAVYFATDFHPLLVLALLQHVQALQQLVPWVRLDGYYVVSDLAGVPDILSRIRPALLSLVPGRPVDPCIAELKTWARTVVRVYVLTVVPVLALMYVLLALNLPRFVGQARRSFGAEVTRVVAAWHGGDAAGLTLALLGMIALALPSLGLALIAVRTVGAVARLVGRVVLVQPRLRATAVAAGAAGMFAAGAAAAAFVGGWGHGDRAAVAAPQRMRAARVHFQRHRRIVVPRHRRSAVPRLPAAAAPRTVTASTRPVSLAMRTGARARTVTRETTSTVSSGTVETPTEPPAPSTSAGTTDVTTATTTTSSTATDTSPTTTSSTTTSSTNPQEVKP